MNVVTWKCHLDDSTKGRYDLILRRGLLTELGLNFKFSEHIIEADDGPFKVYKTLMVDLGKYMFKILIEIKLYLKNVLPMIKSKKYTIQNIYVLQG